MEESKRVLNDEGIILISVFSENVLTAYFEMIKENGLNVAQHDENYVFLKEGLVSERFTRDKLKRIFQENGLIAKIDSLTDISYWCEVRKCN